MSNHTHVLVAGRGYWGRGETFHEAVKNSQWLRKGDKVVMTPCHAETRVNEMGTITFPKGENPGELVHGTIAGTAKEFKFKPE